MLTTPNLVAFLKAIEAFEPRAYDDKQPKLVLHPGDEGLVRGKLTIGYGTTVYPNGMPVRLGDEITEQQGLDCVMHYVRTVIEPVLANILHVKLTEPQYDAIGSLIYNFGPGEVSGWRLPRRINAGEPMESIALEWLTGTVTSKGQPLLGLHRRRIAEVLMFCGLDWRAGMAAGWDDDVLSVLYRMGWTSKVAKPAKAYDDMTDAEKTAALNVDQFSKLGGKPAAGAVSVPVVKKTVELPAIDLAKPPKPMEQSMTHNGLSKADSGKETTAISAVVITGAAATLPVADKVTSYVEKYSPETIFMVLLGFGIIMALIGLWRWMKGNAMAYEGRQNAEGPKV